MWKGTLIALLMASASCVWGADTRAAAAHQREAPTKSAAAKAPARSDAQLEGDIRARFARSKINADKFQVHVQGGVATLEGRTDVIQHKGTATRIAKNAGAAAVTNHIQISDAARQKAAGTLAEGRRRAQIKRGDARSDLRQPRQTR